MEASRELLTQTTISELTVSAITARSKITRSGFYFYFESKYSVLAAMLSQALVDFGDAIHDFAPRAPGEDPAQFVSRILASAEGVYAQHSIVLSACVFSRHSDTEIRALVDRQLDSVISRLVAVLQDEIRAGAARPISADIPMLVRTVVVTGSYILAGESGYVGADQSVGRALDALGKMCVSAFWPQAPQ